MTDKIHPSSFENEIMNLLGSPKPSDEFVERLADRLKLQAAKYEKQAARSPRFKPAFVAFAVAIVFLISSILYFSPEAVYAAVCRLFGYMPGVGIIDENAPLRILKQLVSVTRDGVTISVNSVILTAQETQIDFDITGVPPTAYADKEHASNCAIPEEYLILPDGTRLDSYSPIPTDIDSATFIMPCIFNTLPDTVPTGWEIPLEFIAVPPQATILPVMENTQESVGVESGSNPFTLLVDQFIQDDNEYILIGSFHSAEDLDAWMNITGGIEVIDADGQMVPYSVPEDIQVAGDSTKQTPWVLKFDATGITFPISIHIPGNIYTQIAPHLSASIEFDAGEDPQFGQEWNMNKEITFGKYHILLETIRASENGYTFKFKNMQDVNGNITMPRVQISGFEQFDPVGGGGGGGPDGGETSLDFEQIPTGKLKVTFTNIYAVTDNLSWEVQWQPEDNTGTD